MDRPPGSSTRIDERHAVKRCRKAQPIQRIDGTATTLFPEALTTGARSTEIGHASGSATVPTNGEYGSPGAQEAASWTDQRDPRHHEVTPRWYADPACTVGGVFCLDDCELEDGYIASDRVMEVRR